MTTLSSATPADNVAAAGDWYRANDKVGFGGSDAVGLATTATSPWVLANPTQGLKGDYVLAAEDKYITLTRANQSDATGGTPNPYWSTIYKIELWTVKGTDVDAYRAAKVPEDTADTPQVIGYVDLGKVIDGFIVDDILSHIDYIA